jgi:phosphopantetheine--protein transferase-like protein
MSTILKAAWSQPTSRVAQPGKGGIDVWRLDFPQPAHEVEAMRTSLSTEELARAERFVFPEDRAQYTVMHGALRLLLASLVRINATQIRFAANENGKPFLADYRPSDVSSSGLLSVRTNDQMFVPRYDPGNAAASILGTVRADSEPSPFDTAPQFSISHTQGMGILAISMVRCDGSCTVERSEQVSRHSGRRAAIAVPNSGLTEAEFSRGSRSSESVGVDVEFIRRDFPVEETAERYFSVTETGALRAMPAEEQRRSFFAAWVRKEAWVKAVGAGLDQLPFLGAELQKSLENGGLGKANDLNKGIASVWLQDLEVGPCHTAALAVCGVPFSVRRLIWQPDTSYA